MRARLLDRDFFADLPTPWNFRSSKRRKLSLAAVCAACAVAAGPVATWMALEPALIAEGTFGDRGAAGQKDALSTAYLLATSLMVAFTGPMGVFYDTCGPRVCGVAGAALSCLGLLGMGLAVRVQALNAWLFWAYPLTTIGGMLNVHACFGFLWLFPDHQNVIGALQGAVLSLSDCLAIVGMVFSQQGIPLHRFFWALACCCVPVGVVCHFLAPDSVEKYSSFVMKKRSRSVEVELHLSCGEQAVALEPAPAPRPLLALLRAGVRNIARFPLASALFLAFASAYYVCISVVGGLLYFYWKEVLPGDASVLNTLNAVVFGAGGALCTPLMGAVCDKVELVAFAGLLAVLGCIDVALLLVPNFAAQVLAMLVGVLLYGALRVAVTRFAMLYAPPELFGTYNGLQFTVIGLVQLALLPATNGLAGRGHYRETIFCVGAPFVVLGAMLRAYWHVRPPPAVGAVSLDSLNDA